MKHFPLLAALAAATLVGCATKPPAPLSITETREIAATVTKIDLPKRLLTLRGEAGKELTVTVDPAVRNLPQVKVGDRVVAKYYEALGADLRKAGDPTAPSIEIGDAVAEKGARPGAAIGSRMTVPVTIVSVADKGGLVSFTGADGQVRALTIQRPEAREFVSKLKAGDQVVVTYTEALAIGVEPAK